MRTEWLLQVCKNNGSLKSNKHRRICFAKKSKHLTHVTQLRFANPWNCLNFLHTLNRYTLFPKLFIALKIYMTVTAAPKKRSFVDLKLIKTSFEIFNPTRAPSNFAFLSIAYKIRKGLNINKILKDFAHEREKKFSEQRQHLCRRPQQPKVRRFGLCVLPLSYCMELTHLFHSVLSLLFSNIIQGCTIVLCDLLLSRFFFCWCFVAKVLYLCWLIVSSSVVNSFLHVNNWLSYFVVVAMAREEKLNVVK